ncbi:hypothetical protein GCM10010177_35100 [Actinomadura citrea]|nr:hypothetical protein GCM10010177_35100 [Actinomadura citrea]
MLFYRAAVDLSRATLNYVAGLIRRRRKALGSAWRLLNAGQQALLVLVHLRKGETFVELGAGFPACVGPTRCAWQERARPGNHPRVRGADSSSNPRTGEIGEPSPRARGRPLLTCDAVSEGVGFYSVGL